MKLDIEAVQNDVKKGPEIKSLVPLGKHLARQKTIRNANTVEIDESKLNELREQVKFDEESVKAKITEIVN